MWCKKILVAYDGSPLAAKALDAAKKIASEDEDREIVAVHVMHLLSAGASGWGVDAALEGESVAIQEELEGWAADVSNPCEVKLLEGSNAADVITRYADEAGCDLIVMGSHGKTGIRGYLGSVSFAVIKESDVMVLIVKAE